MTFLVIAIIVLSAFGLSSLFFTRNIFHAMEIISYYMIIVVMIQQVFLISTLNLGMIKISGTIPGYWAQNLNLPVIIPSITVWLFYSYFSPASSPLLKLLLTGAWFLCISGIEALCHRLGLITLIRWNIGYSFIAWLIVLAVSDCFALWYRNSLRKRAYIRSYIRRIDSILMIGSSCSH